MSMNQTLYVRLTTQTQITLFGFCLQVLEERLALMGNMRYVKCFPWMQRRIADSVTEPGSTNLSIANPTVYH